MGPGRPSPFGGHPEGATLGLVSLRWDYLDGEGRPVGSSGPFPDEAAAEEWLAEAWQDLAARSVEAVELREEGRDRVLFRMSLGPE